MLDIKASSIAWMYRHVRKHRSQDDSECITGQTKHRSWRHCWYRFSWASHAADAKALAVSRRVHHCRVALQSWIITESRQGIVRTVWSDSHATTGATSVGNCTMCSAGTFSSTAGESGVLRQLLSVDIDLAIHLILYTHIDIINI